MTFVIAKKIAASACQLDWLKRVADPVASAEAEKYINLLHDCATQLAGVRAHEIYHDPENESHS